MSALEFQEQIARLSKAERLQAMEWLWASLRDEGAAFDSPEWHGKVLAARKAKLESGDAEFLTLDQLKERLRR